MNQYWQKIKIRASRSLPFQDKVQLFVAYETSEKGVRVLRLAEPIKWQQPLDPDTCCDLAPTTTISLDDAQELMDSLWDCGLRPSEGSGSAGQLAATEKHLSDTRSLLTRVLDKLLA